MSIVASSGKTYRVNLSMLRGKTFFREVAQPRAIRRSSTIDSNRLKRKALVIARRKLNQRLRLALVISLIYFLFVIGIAYTGRAY
jgi:hypothetical protein